MSNPSVFKFCSRCGCVSLEGATIIIEGTKVVGFLCSSCIIATLIMGIKLHNYRPPSPF